MGTKSTKAKTVATTSSPVTPIKTQPAKEVPKMDMEPFRSWDLDIDTKFVQYLNVPNIERLFKKLNLVDLNGVSEKNFYYLKGCMDAMYALIGVDTPMKRILELKESDATDQRIINYVNSITDFLNTNLTLRRETIKSKNEVNDTSSEESSSKLVLNHIFNRVKEETSGLQTM